MCAVDHYICYNIYVPLTFNILPFSPFPAFRVAAAQQMVRNEVNLNEISVHGKLCHQNIVRMIEALQSRRNYFLVMEVCSQSLKRYLRSLGIGQLEPLRVRSLFAGALDAIAYIHRKGFVHRDLKLDNLLMCVRNNVETLVICDFGMVVRAIGSNGPFGANPQQICGTLGYLSPEMVDKRIVAHPTLDVWAIGVCMYFCAVGHHPFAVSSAEKMDTIQRIRECVYERQPLHLISRPAGWKLAMLLKRMFVVDYQLRVSIAQVMEDDFFARTEEQLLANKEMVSIFYFKDRSINCLYWQRTEASCFCIS